MHLVFMEWQLQVPLLNFLVKLLAILWVGGETLRVVQPKPDGKVRKQRTALREESSGENELSQQQEERGSGYGVKLAYDVPQTKFNGTLDVRVCWHSLVYLAKVDFGPKNLSF